MGRALLANRTEAGAGAAVAQAVQADVTSASLTSQLGNYALTSAMNAALASRLAQLTGTGVSRSPELGQVATSTCLIWGCTRQVPA